MQKSVHEVLAFVLDRDDVTWLVTPALQPQKGENACGPAPFKLPATITLTDEQKTKLRSRQTELAPRSTPCRKDRRHHH